MFERLQTSRALRADGQLQLQLSVVAPLGFATDEAQTSGEHSSTLEDEYDARLTLLEFTDVQNAFKHRERSKLIAIFSFKTCLWIPIVSEASNE